MRAKKKSMSESAQAFYLRLNNHRSFLTGALSELYHNALLVDCTVTAQGGQLRAHQTVLAAFSPYFKEIFTQYNTSQHPVIVIKDMPFADLKAIIEYIYGGEVMIPRRQLQSVLNNGALLQVKGLHEFNQNRLTDIMGSDVEAEVENQYDFEDNCSDNKSNDNQNDKKSEKTNGLNSCESKMNTEVSTEKETRKSWKSAENCSNGYDKESGKYGKTFSSTVMKTNDNNISTNDLITNNSDNIKDDIKREYSPKESIKLIYRNKRVTEVNEKSSETCLRAPIVNTNVNEHNIEKPMTGKPVLITVSGGANNIVPLMPFAPLYQSIMIDVNPNVNQASDPSNVFCFCFTTNLGTYNTTATTGAATVCADINAVPDISAVEDPKQQNKSQNELKYESNYRNICANNSAVGNQINEIPSFKEINEKFFDVNQTQSDIRKRSLISATNEVKKYRIIKNKISKECKDTKNSKNKNSSIEKNFEGPSYVTKQNTKEQLRSAHTSPQKKYVCTACQKEYGLKHALDRHLKSKHTAN